MRIYKKILLSYIVIITITLTLSYLVIIRNVNNKEYTKKRQTISLSSVDNKKLDEIRNRESVKNQQELIVQEVYLLEKKKQIEKEKTETILKLDSEIQKIEKKLEEIRKEKLSFQ